MGAPDLPFRRVTDLAAYVERCFDHVERTFDDLRPYQNTAIEFLLAHPFSALFIDVGMGKSVISLTAMLRIITEMGDFDPWLVIAPRRVANETWPTEIQQWQHTAGISYVHIREDEIVAAVNAAGKAERREIVEELLWQGLSRAEVAEKIKGLTATTRINKARLHASQRIVREHFRNNPATIHIINREQVEWLVGAWGRAWPYKNVLVDESSSLKDHTTNRFKALRRVRPLIKRMHQLTATPAAETYMHLFAQIFLLDEGERFGRHITKFQKRYFTQSPYTRKWELRPGGEEDIAAKIADIALVMKAEDYLDLEKPQVLMRKVTLSSEQMALYKTMETDSIVSLPGGVEIEAETAAALSQKLLQMASGVLYETVVDDVGDGNFKKRRVVHHLHDSKLEALQELVEETQGECLLVAYWHDSSLARLKVAFPQAEVMDEDGKCVKRWNARKIPMLLVHPQSAGHGLNMQHGGRRIVFFDIPWSLELYLQLLGRLDGARQLARAAHERVVFLHLLVAEGTLDEAVVEALAGKKDAQDLLFRLLKRMRKKLLRAQKCQETVSYNEQL